MNAFKYMFVEQTGEYAGLCSIISFLPCFQHFKGLSFPTISSVGPNAAIIHYSPKAETCAELDPDKIYLFDSGAQVCLVFNCFQHRHIVNYVVFMFLHS